MSPSHSSSGECIRVIKPTRFLVAGPNSTPSNISVISRPVILLGPWVGPLQVFKKIGQSFNLNLAWRLRGPYSPPKWAFQERRRRTDRSPPPCIQVERCRADDRIVDERGVESWSRRLKSSTWTFILCERRIRPIATISPLKMRF